MTASTDKQISLYTESDALAWVQCDTNKMSSHELANLPVSWFRRNDGKIQVLSWFADNTWEYPSNRFTKAVPTSQQRINFNTIPACFHAVTKHVLRTYDVTTNPAGLTLMSNYKNLKLFLCFIHELSVNNPSRITPMLCANYVKHLNERKGPKGILLASRTKVGRLLGIETLYRYTAGSEFSFPHPWPDSSASYLAGFVGRNHNRKAKTKVIPDNVLVPLVQGAVTYLDRADDLLTLRDYVADTRKTLEKRIKHRSTLHTKISESLPLAGYDGTLGQLNNELRELQTACMIVILTLSGIRVHELASIQNDPWFKDVDDNGDTTFWMRGHSTKTGEGDCEWLVPELVIKALTIAEWHAKPCQAFLQEQVATMREVDENCAMANNKEHIQHNLFLSTNNKKSRVVCLTGHSFINRINKFSKKHGITMHLTPHQFRRTFAVYVAKSAYGDLRYLREHFKHWSLDMTILYALSDKQDSELYDEIMTAIIDEKVTRVTHWLDGDSLLSGGGAKQIRAYRDKFESVITYEKRRDMAERVSDTIYLRSSGSAWCTADNAGCTGFGVMENTRCADCENGVVDDSFTETWIGIYLHTMELRNIDDIGAAGKARINRDIERCEDVLREFGILDICKKAYRENKKHGKS